MRAYLLRTFVYIQTGKEAFFMGRAKRLLVDNGVYHIMSRGHNRYKTFHTLDDYKTYKKLLKKCKKKFCFDVFHYCLMPNHIHLLLRISKGIEMPHLMQMINQSYARYYKKSYGLIGNLFQGRYKSLLIGKDEYLLECGRYIERNPLRANIVTDLSKYAFSSFNFYSKGIRDSIVTPNSLYAELSKVDTEKKKLYTEYILQPRAYEEVVDRQFRI